VSPDRVADLGDELPVSAARAITLRELAEVYRRGSEFGEFVCKLSDATVGALEVPSPFCLAALVCVLEGSGRGSSSRVSEARTVSARGIVGRTFGCAAHGSQMPAPA
jgi:hypothetical protein